MKKIKNKARMLILAHKKRVHELRRKHEREVFRKLMEQERNEIRQNKKTHGYEMWNKRKSNKAEKGRKIDGRD